MKNGTNFCKIFPRVLATDDVLPTLQYVIVICQPHVIGVVFRNHQPIYAGYCSTHKYVLLGRASRNVTYWDDGAPY